MSSPHFETDKEPCIPVLFPDGRQEELGWRDVLLRAHLIKDLALPVPPAASAVLRLLVVMAARVSGLDARGRRRMTARQWAARRRELLAQPAGFDPDAVHAYFDAYVWDLFHPARPFLQDPRLASQCPQRAGVNKLVFGRPEGNNLSWLSPHSDSDPQPVPSAQALWHMLIHHYYGAAGQWSVRTVGDRSLSRAKAGPLRSSLSFHPLGRTLYETLLAGIPKPDPSWPDAVDHCPWEEPLPDPDPDDDGDPVEGTDPDAAPPPVSSPGRLLTGRSRHAVLLIPAPDGRHVTDAYLTWATQKRLPALDPYLIHHVHADEPVTRRHRPRRADADRALWRDLDALLLAGDEDDRKGTQAKSGKGRYTVQRPDAFTTLNDLPPDLRAALRVRVYGFDQDGKTKNRTWYTALTPPIWPWTQECDPAAAERIAACRKAAEDIGAHLDRLSQDAWKQTTNSGSPRHLPPWTRSARTLYWPRAEATFWILLNEPARSARAAFAADAIDALRTATRPAIAQHFRAAEAVATALAQLRLRGR
ncbi:type I-E CRISPR-associated protein Cse1/CasA [Streptomyces sp. RK31]|uniref:type I-E CRISPR-associated protein Cse1/CasA n=1 Tax=Streptomyces sp. RK31 TaxID=2824892 RepID=UPI0027DD26C8|nr:type I-E CRISPR-associated protein Cse1/CasA [Streptomyces sp. RK31]